MVLSKLIEIYEKYYKQLMLIPFLLLFFAISYIVIHYISTGEVINRDVSLKGGVTITIPLEKKVNLPYLEERLSSRFKLNDISVRALRVAGTEKGVIVEADIKEDEVEKLLDNVEELLGIKLTKKDYNIEIIGSTLGASFFREAIMAIGIAFLFMGVVVFLYFRRFVPSLAVILSALSDIVVSLAIVNLLKIKLSSAGIAAFLMLIGYSVDTDILLSTRVLKRRVGSVMERILSAMKTGLTMSFTTIAAVIVAMLLTRSEIIKQIMLILFIGLIIDLINTWIQNVGLLRLYLEKKHKNAL